MGRRDDREGFITFDCCVGIIKERLEGRGIVDSARCCPLPSPSTPPPTPSYSLLLIVSLVSSNSAWEAEASLTAQQWRHSNGAQRWQRRWRRRDGGDGDYVMNQCRHHVHTNIIKWERYRPDRTSYSYVGIH